MLSTRMIIFGEPQIYRIENKTINQPESITAKSPLIE